MTGATFLCNFFFLFQTRFNKFLFFTQFFGFGCKIVVGLEIGGRDLGSFSSDIITHSHRIPRLPFSSVAACNLTFPAVTACH